MSYILFSQKRNIKKCLFNTRQIIRSNEVFALPCRHLGNRAGDASSRTGLPRGVFHMRILRYTTQQRRSFWSTRRPCLLQACKKKKPFGKKRNPTSNIFTSMNIHVIRPHYELICCSADYGSTSGSIEDLTSPGVSPLPAYYSTAEQSSIISSGTLGVQKGRPRKRKLSEVAGSELPVTMRLAAGALGELHVLYNS